MGSFFCLLVEAFFAIPQGILDSVFGLFGQTAPNLTFGIGSIFGCNL